jgi:hypothetical protein
MSVLTKLMGGRKVFFSVIYGSFLAVSCLLLFSFTFLFPAEENYKVIKVVGSIVLKKTGTQLAQGDVIAPTETIIFKSTDAKASVISPSNGRFILSSNGQIKQEGSSLKSNLLPAMNNISSRSGSILNLLDLQNYCKGSHVILEELPVFIDSRAFPMNDTCFFFIRYEYKGEQIDKKVGYKGDTLLINAVNLFTIDHVPVEIPATADASLYYYAGKTARLLAPFQLVFPEEKQLVNELGILLEGSKVKTYKEKISEVISYLNEFYGNPDRENVQHWIRVKMNVGQ